MTGQYTVALTKIHKALVTLAEAIESLCKTKTDTKENKRWINATYYTGV